MNNFILISRTYAETTPESVEIGDFSDHGFISEREEVTFTELVELMKIHMHPSSSPNNGSVNVWYSTGFSTSNFRTGTEREESLHFHHENAPNAAKYWKLARKFANKPR